MSICARIVLAAFAALPAAVSATPVTTWNLSGGDVQYLGDNKGGGVGWIGYGIATLGSSQLPNGLKIFGTGAGNEVFALTGATYVPTPPGAQPGDRGNQLVIFGTGTIDGAAWQHPVDLVRTTFDIGFNFSGGTLDVYKVESSYTLFNAVGEFITGVGSGIGGGFGVFDPGGYGVGTAFEDRFGADITSATTIAWAITIGFDWTGYQAADSLAFTIPQNSIDIQAVPTPGVLALAGVAGLVAARRRR